MSAGRPRDETEFWLSMAAARVTSEGLEQRGERWIKRIANSSILHSDFESEDEHPAFDMHLIPYEDSSSQEPESESEEETEQEENDEDYKLGIAAWAVALFEFGEPNRPPPRPRSNSPQQVAARARSRDEEQEWSNWVDGASWAVDSLSSVLRTVGMA